MLFKTVVHSSDPAIGAVDTTSGTTYGEQATYTCNVGYNLAGNAQTLCKADGNWETAPICQIVSQYIYKIGTSLNHVGIARVKTV